MHARICFVSPRKNKSHIRRKVYMGLKIDRKRAHATLAEVLFCWVCARNFVWTLFSRTRSNSNAGSKTTRSSDSVCVHTRFAFLAYIYSETHYAVLCQRCGPLVDIKKAHSIVFVPSRNIRMYYITFSIYIYKYIYILAGCRAIVCRFSHSSFPGGFV